VLITAVELLERMRWLPFSRTLGAAVDKVRGALPRGRQAELDRLRANLSFVGVPAQAASAEVIAAVEDAWFDDQELQIEYRGSGGVTSRRVRIRSVVMERTEVLLNCDDLDKGAARQFRLHRIERATLPERPETFR
jgi:predicted DNA-binding transcriptional regulator YafY